MNSLKSQPIFTIRDIMIQNFAQYATVKPTGIILTNKNTVNPIDVIAVKWHPARTLYASKKPKCRSLDGVKSISEKKYCGDCDNKNKCTPQIAFEFLYKTVPFRLMLAYTSAKNFIKFISVMNKNKDDFEGKGISMEVKNRAKWGEVCFYDKK
jgi:hypothetical protein